MLNNSIYVYSLLHNIEELMFTHKVIKDKEELLLSISDFIKEHFENIKNADDTESLKRLSDLAHNIAIYEKPPKSKDESSNKALRPFFSYALESENEVVNSQATYNSKPLDFANIFPINSDELKKEDTVKLLKSFLEELKLIKDEEQLLYILEKYLWSIPNLQKISVLDISLYDHLKTSAALSLSLYNQYIEGNFTYKDLKDGVKSNKNQFILINGEISGIQNFIFNTSSKGAAKSLKGRSIYIQLISDIIVNYLLCKLELKKANLLYQGGGNFYIIAPACKVEAFEIAKKQTLKNLLLAHDGDLYAVMDYILLCPLDFKNFSNQWDRVKEKVNLQKLIRWTELELKDTFDFVCGPLNYGSVKSIHCKICGVEINLGEGIDYKLDENKDVDSICGFCRSFMLLTNEIKDANYYILKTENSELLENPKITSCNDVFKLFGYDIKFRSKLTSYTDYTEKTEAIYKLNDTNFLEKKCSGFKFGTFSLPMKEYGQITFKDVAEKSKGDNKIVLLKIDVDNSGYLFNKCFSNNKSISRVTTLSRMLALYFEGYINKLIEDNKWSGSIYTVFSGGDDTFILGSRNDVLDFVYKFNKNFKGYVCNNDKITFSVGIGIYHYIFPMRKPAAITEYALEQSENCLYLYEDSSSKNKVTIFGETFNWEEFIKIKEIKTIIVSMAEADQKKDDKNFEWNLLYKLYKGIAGLKPILDKTAIKGKFDNIRFCRPAYYLRDMKGKSKEIDYAERFIKVYNQIVIDNLVGQNKDEEIRNIKIIPAAIEWAELEIRRRTNES